MKKALWMLLALALLLAAWGTAGAAGTDPLEQRPTNGVCPCCGGTVKEEPASYQDSMADGGSKTKLAIKYSCTNGCCYYSVWGETGSYAGELIIWGECYGGEATCTEKAKCTKCKTPYGSRDHDNHEFSVNVAKKEATCTEWGWTAYKECRRCRAKNEEYRVLPAGHDFSVNVAEKKADCTATGYTAHKECSRCGEKNEEYRVTGPLGHDFSVKVAEKKATCTEDGYTAHKECSRCGEKNGEYKKIPAAGHTPVTDPAVEPTETESGLTEGSHCSVCGEVLVAQEEIPPTGKHTHTPVTDPRVEPTCTEPGLTEGSHCEECGTVLRAFFHQKHCSQTQPKSSSQGHIPWGYRLLRMLSDTVPESAIWWCKVVFCAKARFFGRFRQCSKVLLR